MTRDEMIEKLEAVEQFCTYQINDAAARLDKRANSEAVKACIDIHAVLAALRAPAVTGEGAQPLMVRAIHDRDTRPWRYYQFDAATLQKMCEHLADKLAAFEAKTHQDSLQNAAPPAAGAPPALVALRKRAQELALYAFREHGNDATLYNALADMGGVSPDGTGWLSELDVAMTEPLTSSPVPAPVAPPADGSVMVRVDPVYVEQMRGDGLAGPFSRITLDERGGVPTLLLTAEPKPTPDTAEWWRAVAQELGVEIHKLKLAAQSVPSDLVRISQPGHSVVRVSQPGQSPAPPAVAGGDAPPEIQVGDVVAWQTKPTTERVTEVICEGSRYEKRMTIHEWREHFRHKQVTEVERNGVVIWRRRQEGQ